MSIRTILTGEDEPVLHKVCHPVTSFDQKLADLLDDMKETLPRPTAWVWPPPRWASSAGR